MKNDYSNLTFEQIYIFLTAAKFENFSKAADSLNISQSAVSRNIYALEDALGIVLFIRHQRRVQLTKAGKYLVPELEQLLQKTSGIVDKAYYIQGNQFNTLSVSSANVLRNNQYLLPVVLKFQEKNPQVDVSLEIMDPFKQMEQLIEGFYDVGIVASAYTRDLRENGLLVHSIRKDFPEIMLSDRHPLYAHAEENIAELLTSPIVITDDDKHWYPPVCAGNFKKDKSSAWGSRLCLQSGYCGVYDRQRDPHLHRKSRYSLSYCGENEIYSPDTSPGIIRTFCCFSC